jgi:hypothetical protein
MNIGTIGHVAHGKSTLVRAVSGTNVSLAILLTFAHRPFVTSVKSSVTLLSSLVMLTLSFSSAQLALPLNALSLSAHLIPTRLSAPTRVAPLISSL